MPEEEKKEQTLFKKLTGFYFSSNWYSFLTIPYLLFFLYSAFFYFDNIILTLKFLIYTLRLSTPLLGLAYMFWGTIFIIALIIPFSVSISAIIVFHNLWKETKLEIKQKFITTIFVIFLARIIIITMDDIIRFVAKQKVLSDFVQRSGLTHRLSD